MLFKYRATAAAVCLAVLAGLAAAQQAGGSPPGRQTAVPRSSQSPGPVPIYRSAFEGYKPLNEQPVLSWRESNDVVGRVGGWQAYAREGQGSAAASSAGAASTSTPAVSPDAHTGQHNR